MTRIFLRRFLPIAKARGFHAALLVTDIYFDFKDFSGRGADFTVNIAAEDESRH